MAYEGFSLVRMRLDEGARFPIAYAELSDDTLCGVPLDEGEQVMLKRLVSMIPGMELLEDGWYWRLEEDQNLELGAYGVAGMAIQCRARWGAVLELLCLLRREWPDFVISDHLFDGWVHDPASFARHIERSDKLAAATEALKAQRTVGVLTEQEFRLRAGELASAYRRGASQR